MNWKIKVFTLKSIQGMISVSNRQHQKFTELSLSVVRDAVESNISNSVIKTQILLNQVANGIYNYEVEFGNKNKSFGKLTILK